MKRHAYPGLPDALNCGIIAIDADARVAVWNDWMADRSGISGAQAVGLTLAELFPGLKGSRLERAVGEALRPGLSTVLSHNLHPTPFPLFTPRHGVLPDAPAPIKQSTVVRPVRSLDGLPGCVIQVSDVTATVVRENKLREMADYARSLIEASIDPFLTIGRGGTVTDVNGATIQVTGRPRTALVGSRFVERFTDPEQAGIGLEAALCQGVAKDVPLSIRHESGAVTDLLFNISVYRDSKGEVDGILAAGRDMTQQKAAERELIRLATIDPLTETCNRRHFLELAERELLRANRCQCPVSMLSVDADHFKAVNDTYGHAAGDEVLRRLVALWRLHLRETDLIGRFGGEEFLILLPETDLAEAVRVAERLRAAVASMLIHSHGHSFQVTASIGVAEIGREETLQRALGRVDLALYAAKQSGRNRFCLAPPATADRRSTSGAA